MTTNNKQTSTKVASVAGKALSPNSGASQIQKSLAGSALSQAGTGRQTGAAVEAKASSALRNAGASKVTQQLAGSVVSQSNKKR